MKKGAKSGKRIQCQDCVLPERDNGLGDKMVAFLTLAYLLGCSTRPPRTVALSNDQGKTTSSSEECSPPLPSLPPELLQWRGAGIGMDMSGCRGKDQCEFCNCSLTLLPTTYYF